MGGFRFDYEFCDRVVSASAASALKARAAARLEADHDDALREAYSETYGGSPCVNCGDGFPTDATEDRVFDCPERGHDNFEPFVRRYDYWRIEAE